MSKERRRKKSTHVTEEPNITHLVVSQSHSPFFNFSFSIMVASKTKPPNTSLSDCHGKTSQVSVLPAVAPAVHCGIFGFGTQKTVGPNIARPSAKPTKPNQLLLYIVCVNARWEPSHAARRRKPQGHLYIVLFLMFVCMCVGVCMRVFKGHHPMWKKEKKKHEFNHDKYGGQKRRPLISSPSMQ